jgi:hypothetical protein
VTLEQTVLDAVRTLSPEKREELRKFVDILRSDQGARSPLADGYGMLAHLGFRLSAEDIDDARREMWQQFPRDASGMATIW